MSMFRSAWYRLVQWRERRNRDAEHWRNIRWEARRRLQTMTSEERRAFFANKDPDRWRRFFAEIEEAAHD